MKSIKTILGLSLILLAVISSRQVTHSGSENSRPVYHIPITSEINYGEYGFVRRGIEDALQDSAALIILQIDTYGGRVDACIDIVGAIDSAGEVPVYAFVEDNAWSAGALIALACEKIYMKDGSTIGSATPVTGEGEELSEKYVSAIRAKFLATAQKNGHPQNIAAAMVDQNIKVSEVLIDGEKRYLTPEQIEKAAENKDVTISETVSDKGQLLNLTARDAARFTLSEGTKNNIESILEKEGMRESPVVKITKNWAEHLASFLTGGMVSSLLMTLGFLFLFLEFEEPGLGVPGILGICCFGLFFFGRHIVYLADWIHVLLFAIGVLLILLEIFVIPDFGLSGIAGGALVLLSVYFALSPFSVPRQPWDFQTFQINLLMIMSSLIVSIIGSLVIIHNMDKIPGLNKVMHAGNLVTPKSSCSGVQNQKQPEKANIKIGTEGTAVTDLRPVGRIRFGERIFDGVSQQGFVEKGTKVKVIETGDNRILVEKKET